MLRRRGKNYTARTFVPIELQGVTGRAEITRTLQTADTAEAERRRALWGAHLAAYFGTIRRHGHKMTRAQIDRLTRRYLEATFEEIEERLALDWSDAGRDAHVFDLNDEAHMLGGMLASGDYGDFTAQAAALLPDAETETQRRLARRLIETKLDATAAEINAFRGEPLRRPTQGDTSGATEGEPKDSPPVSEAARLYGDQRVQLRAWSPKTEKLHRSIFDALAELLGDPPIGEVTKADMRQLAADLVNLPANVTKVFPGVALREALMVGYWIDLV